jgi:hypothetical protein
MLSFYSAKDSPERKPSKHPKRTSKQIKGAVVGASILCFSIDPVFKRIYFLLGKERHNRRWPAGSSKWSDFGGGVIPGDACAEQIAAREFVEETLGVVKFGDNFQVPITSPTEIAEELKAGKYLFKILTGNKYRKFVMFVKQIPWDPECTVRFSEYRSLLTRPRDLDTPSPIDSHPAIAGRTSIKKEYLEKKMLAFFSVTQLRYAVDHDGVILNRNGYVEHCRKNFVESLDIVFSEFSFIVPWVLNE